MTTTASATAPDATVPPVRVGAIGAGWWATTNHFPLLKGRADVELVSVCRPDKELLDQVQSRFGFHHATVEYRELLDQDLDAVIVASPHHLHHEHAAAALRRGLHVMCEKPMTLRADHAWDLVDLADTHGVHGLVPYGWHYQGFVQEAKRWMDQGLVGDIEYAMCHMASPTKEFFSGHGGVPRQWTPSLVAPDPGTWQRPENGGGYLHGQVTHSAALLLWLTGLRAATASAVTTAPGAPVELYAAARVQFTTGAIGVVSGAGTLPGNDKFQVDVRIFGTAGVLLLDVERERAVLRRHDGSHREAAVQPGDGAYSCSVPPVHFVQLIKGETTTNHSPFSVAARCVELVEALATSAASSGETVTLMRDDNGSSSPEPTT